MDLIDRIRDIANRASNQRDHIQTEEATKNALVMPFIGALGYDIFNPTEVIPEYTADVGTKKGEKVDYAIQKDGDIIILIECKSISANLNDAHEGQLFRYFSVTDARFGILTNGVVYRFYSDLDKVNKMDSRPFFELDVTDFHDDDIEELKKFSKSAFSLESILETANALKYLRASKKLLAEQLTKPGTDFVRFIASNVYDGRLTAQVLEQFNSVVKTACKQFLDDKVNERLKSALSNSYVSDAETISESDAPVIESENVDVADDKGIVTTDEEVEGFMVVKAILRQNVDLSRVAMRDTKSYFGILLDDNNRKPICRLHFNASQKYLGIIGSDKNEIRHPIDSLDDIYEYSDQIVATLALYE